MIALQVTEASAGLLVEGLHRLLTDKREALATLRCAGSLCYAELTEHDFGIPQIEELIAAIDQAEDTHG